MTKQKIWSAVELYVGLKANRVELVEDPHVKGTVAIRATFGTARPLVLTFIVREGDDKATVSWIRDNLEECQFTEWPPTSNGRRG